MLNILMNPYISAAIVLTLCAYILYLTYRLHIAEELIAVFRSNSAEIRDSLNSFERQYPHLYLIHQNFFANIRKCTYNRR